MEGLRILDVLLVGVAAARPRRLDGPGVDAQRPPLPPRPRLERLGEMCNATYHKLPPGWKAI